MNDTSRTDVHPVKIIDLVYGICMLDGHLHQHRLESPWLRFDRIIGYLRKRMYVWDVWEITSSRNEHVTLVALHKVTSDG